MEHEKIKVSEKKLLKQNKLYDAAYDLFISKGINNTAIDDIVKKAGVAKGTFYLYFKNKYDIVDKLVLKRSCRILKEAMDIAECTMKNKDDDFIESVIIFIDYIIEYLRKNKKQLKIIYKDLSWGFFRKAASDSNKEMENIVDIFIKKIQSQGMDKSEAEKTLFMIIELTGAVCYSSIILKEPDTIDNMKPILFSTIKKMLVTNNKDMR